MMILDWWFGMAGDEWVPLSAMGESASSLSRHVLWRGA
ncbi:hypothetical protein E9229_002345 [Paeniglutamicibacter cryotolerans]|uniref:Uncharacterized protein n=1 Tax=Paeniglutamicibacter cryotolerans TaxID=670079 RepID=A0A839QN09_9MICC|nr:hypothetical protein [Paeniglutamicibacter cryotolerans]